jgi:hypothetical protein
VDDSKYYLRFNADPKEYHMYLKIHNKIILCSKNECFKIGDHFFNFDMVKESENPVLTTYNSK